MELQGNLIFRKSRGRLVLLFKQQFLVFKRHYTYFYTFFYPHVFPQNNNITRNLLPNDFRVPKEGHDTK